jgi:hypothetical protein
MVDSFLGWVAQPNALTVILRFTVGAVLVLGFFAALTASVWTVLWLFRMSTHWRAFAGEELPTVKRGELLGVRLFFEEKETKTIKEMSAHLAQMNRSILVLTSGLEAAWQKIQALEK